MIPTTSVFSGAQDVAHIARVPLADRLPARDLPGLLEHAVRSRPQSLAIRFLSSGRLSDTPVDITYAALWDRVLSAAGVLVHHGVDTTDVVAFLLPNRPETLAAILAAQVVGIAAPINMYLEAAEIAGLLDAMNARVLVAHGEIVEAKLEAVLAACRQAPRVLRLDDLHASVIEPLGSLRDRGDEHVALFHTGGTTGLPKLVPLSGLNLAATAWFSTYAYGYTAGDTVLAAMPMFHVGGLLASSLIPLLNGACVVIDGELGYRGSGTMAEVWALAAREAVTVVIGPPTVMGQLALAMPERAEVPALRLLINGAAALPVAIGNRLVEHLGVQLTEPWGLTEACLAATSMPLAGMRRAGSVGVALPYCEVKAVAVDADGRECGDCPVDTIGVLAIRGPSVFGGYRGATLAAQPFFADGWLDTGDLGRVDAEGYVWITGRAKDLIKRGGHGIDPATIETALYAHPAVALAAAVGKPDAYAGELPMAYVQLKPGCVADAADLLAWAAARITERAAIPKELVILEALPLTGVGKVHKPQLRLDAARRTFAALLHDEAGPAAAQTVEAQAHPRHGTSIRMRVPAAQVAAVQALFAPFPLHFEVDSL